MAVLQGSTAIVTGASSGIGRATAHRLGAEGSHVFIAGRSGERLGALAQSIEPRAERQAPAHSICAITRSCRLS